MADDATEALLQVGFRSGAPSQGACARAPTGAQQPRLQPIYATPPLRACRGRHRSGAATPRATLFPRRPADAPLPRMRTQEVHAPWEFASRLETGGVEVRTTVKELLAGQGDSVVTTLQRTGVSKLGEFVADSNLVYPAFDGEPILTLGSRERDVDYEALWTRRLNALAPKEERPTGAAPRGTGPRRVRPAAARMPARSTGPGLPATAQCAHAAPARRRIMRRGGRAPPPPPQAGAASWWSRRLL